jgi:hypothetical protein
MDKVADFILTLLHAATNTHILHWQATRYGEHQALGEFYTGLPDLIDQLTEALMGRYEMQPQFPIAYYGPNPDSLQELVTLKEYVQQERMSLPQDSEIQNLVDEIATSIDSTIYKLKFLK